MTDKFMMRGTSGNYDYYVLTRRGNFGLAVKPYGFNPGPRDGEDHYTFVTVRVRVAPWDTVTPQDTQVAMIGKTGGTPQEAWPEITYDSSDHVRAAGNASILLPGSPFGPLTQRMLFRDAFAEHNVTEQLANKLIELVGDDVALITKADLKEVFDQHYNKYLGQIEQKSTAIEAALAKMKESIGTFTFQANAIKKMVAEEAYKSEKKAKKTGSNNFDADVDDVEEDEGDDD